MSSLIPAVKWVRDYDRSWLVPDLVAGLAAGAVVVPQAMAYATIADLPVQVGLYTCMVPMLVYVMLGGSRSLSVSTTSTIAILTASTLLAGELASHSSDPARELATLTLLVGLILLVARLLRVASIIDNINTATLTGIKFGVGLTVAAGQLPKILGVPGDPSASSFFAEIRGVWKQIDDVSVTTLAFSIGTIAVLVLIAKFAPKVPGPLIAAVGGIALVAFTSLDQHGIALIAPVPSGLPTPIAPAFDHVSALLPGAFGIAIMVFLETVAVARTVRRRSEPAIDNNQELVAVGLSSTLGSFFRAMPSAGGFSQTAINQRSGAQTQLSEFVTALLAVACALFLGSVLSDLPQATLGCLVMVAVFGLFKPAELVRFWQVSRIEFWVAMVTAGAGLVFGLLIAVLIGVLLTLFLVLYELNTLGVTELQPTTDGEDVRFAGSHTARVPGLLVLRLDGALYTANVRGVNSKIIDALDALPGVEVLIIDASAQTMLTITVMDEYAAFERELTGRGVTMWMAALPPRTLATTKLAPRWKELEGAGRFFPTTLAAVKAFQNR